MRVRSEYSRDYLEVLEQDFGLTLPEPLPERLFSVSFDPTAYESDHQRQTVRSIADTLRAGLPPAALDREAARRTVVNHATAWMLGHGHRCVAAAIEFLATTGYPLDVPAADCGARVRRLQTAAREVTTPSPDDEPVLGAYRAAADEVVGWLTGGRTGDEWRTVESAVAKWYLTPLEILGYARGHPSDAVVRMSAYTLALRVRHAGSVAESLRGSVPESLIQNAVPSDAPGVVQLYREAVIPRERLEGLVAPDPAVRLAARREVRLRAGFLHPAPPDPTRYFPPAGLCKVFRDEDGRLRAYYGVLTDPGLVRRACAEELGWRGGAAYRAPSDLPARCGPGGACSLTWTNPDLALEVFSNLDRLALPGELIVSEPRNGALPARGQKLGRALKVVAYRHLSQFTSCRITLTRVFELLRVNAEPLLPPCGNLSSLALNLDLGAVDIGVLRETFARPGGVTVEVNWRLLVSYVPDLLDRAGASESAPSTDGA